VLDPAHSVSSYAAADVVYADAQATTTPKGP
jgi:hypothetical protein